MIFPETRFAYTISKPEFTIPFAKKGCSWLKMSKLPSSNVLSSRSNPLRSQESLGNGFPPSVMQVSLTLSPDLCSERKSPWIWGGEGGSVMQKFNRITFSA